MMPGDLSELNLIKPRDYSKFLNILVHALAVITGVIVFLIVSVSYFYLLGNYYSENTAWIFIGFLGLILFTTFLVSGALFSFVWNKGGWKLGLSLGILPVIGSSIFILYSMFFEGEVHFLAVCQLISITLPELVGGCVGCYLGASYKKRQRPNNGIV
jgi:lipid-A-disaccharide synthase-like uncharacterized protein